MIPIFARQRAFSFAEILVATLIFAFGVIPIFLLFSRGSTGTIMTKEETYARMYADEMIDIAMALGYDDPRLVKGVIKVDQLPHTGKEDPRFNRFLIVEEVNPTCGWQNWPMSYKVLTASITWESSGVNKSFVLTGLIFKGTSIK